MADTPLVMPQLGNEITEAQIDLWLKSVGETVEAGEALVSITTPKVSMELEAPVSGILAEIRVAEDEIAGVGATLAVIVSAP